MPAAVDENSAPLLRPHRSVFDALARAPLPYDVFGAVCAEKSIEHRLTRPYHPWTNGQAERMVRTIKDATVRAFHYATIDDLRRHVHDWLLA